jgi:ketosteroid isomerase-like protein
VPPTTSTRQQREDVLRAHMESENEQRFDDTIATFAHPRYELVATGEVFDGEAAVRGYYRTSRARVPDQRNEVIAVHHTDDAVIVEFWLRGTPAGGTATFECRMTALFVFDDSDRITCERVYWDRQTIAAQLG